MIFTPLTVRHILANDPIVSQIFLRGAFLDLSDLKLLVSSIRLIAKALVPSSSVSRCITLANSQSSPTLPPTIEMESLSFEPLAGCKSVATENVIVVCDDNHESVFASDDACNAVGLTTDADKSIAAKAAKKCPAPGADKGSCITFTVGGNSEDTLRTITLCRVPTALSRNNTPSKSHAVGNLVKANRGSGDLQIVLLPSNKEWITAQAVAAARQFPLYCEKKSFREKLAAGETYTVNLVFDCDGSESACMQDTRSLCNSVRWACKLVDMPANVLNCTSYTAVAEQVALDLNNAGKEVKTTIIKGKELEAQGFGGLFGVGKASEHPPALVVLSHTPSGKENEQSVCMVGKGIVYDTGGLSIKVPPNMAGMKSDMGGSAAVLMSFKSIVERGGLDRPCHALLCIAENSVDERACRPDDIHTMLSGKSVEINNTDAEGRLVLGDGVHYAATRLNPKVIMDIATLTGAQLVCTGRRHSALFSNDEALEEQAMRSGKSTGDLCFPMLYCPEFHREMFSSACADMKNSVSDRMNAQSSCAGQFIGNHLEQYLDNGGKWIHIDMAGPSMEGARATGYGVSLLYDVANNCSTL